MTFDSALDAQDSRGYNHCQGMTDFQERRLQYHTLDVQDDILKSPQMVARAMENFDISDYRYFEALMSRLFDATADTLGEVREDMGEFLRSKLGKEITAQADARLAAEVE